MKNWRFVVLLVFCFIFGAVIIGRLFHIQVLNGKYYQSQALGQQVSPGEIEGDRGEVFFSDSRENRGNYGSGETKGLAVNKDRWTLSVVPSKIKDKIEFAEIISAKVGLSEEIILEKFSEKETYAILKKDLSAEETEEIRRLAKENSALTGLFLENNSSRYYPQEKLASPIIGFVGGEKTGQYGIEGYYDEIMRGKRGLLKENKWPGLTETENKEGQLNGSDLYLTIDYNIQFQAESLLREAKENISIDSGQVVVLKPDSGRVLAIANFPQFNPNEYSKEGNFDIFQNSAVQKIFEPGSVLKPFTMAMALNESKVSPESTFVDEGFVKIGPDTVHNFDNKVYGKQTMSEILEKSINTGAVYLSTLLSRDIFLGYLPKFGFDDKTSIDLQGESYSRNEILKTGSDFGLATAAFGQGIEMTPIQLARAFCVFANGGRMVKPYVVEKIVKGGEESVAEPEKSEPVISSKTVSGVSNMLVNVVENGYGKAAKINGYYLAGKTGTAQIPIENGRGYYSDKTIQSFIGFGPALNPQFLILVKLDNPKVSQSALSAAPIFKKLAQYIINYWQIPPDY